MYAVDEVELPGINLTRSQCATAVHEAHERGVTAPLHLSDPTSVLKNVLMPAPYEAQALYESFLPPSGGLGIA